VLRTDEMTAGLALNQISFQASMLVGPALAGLVLGWLGVGGCYLIDAVTFGLAFYGAVGLPPLPPDGERSRPGLYGSDTSRQSRAGPRAMRALRDPASHLRAGLISVGTGAGVTYRRPTSCDRTGP
jgi:hypothetical protein